MGKSRKGRFAIIAETAADARDVMIEGDSGILRTHPKEYRPAYEPSKRRLTWPNGAWATIFNATEPDQLRGPQHDGAWCDELAKWRYATETYDNLVFGLRLGDLPQKIITTTPRPIPILKMLLADPKSVVTRGTTYDNATNLSGAFLTAVKAKYEGTRLGRQELSGEVLDDIPGALWTRDMIERNRCREKDLPQMRRVVVAIDPAAKGKDSADDDLAETGIVVCGQGVDNKGYVLADATCSLPPNGWARKAIAVLDLYNADRVVAEVNNGGDMVEQVLRTVRPMLSYTAVTASRGKTTRAEPVAALYEQDRIRHVGGHPQLEDQMMLFTPFGMEGETTGDRVDALVWGLTDLFPSIIAARPQRKPRPANVGMVY
jgi:phage terminase large subunit-like protein